jgi:UDPglucose 6-dehydrogenase
MRTPVGFVGLGKLGLPIAHTMASLGAEVWGYDPFVQELPRDLSHEDGFDDVVKAAGDRFKFTKLDEIVKHCPLIFCAVQTPHDEQFDGTHKLPRERRDFNYTVLKIAVGDIGRMTLRHKTRPTVAVISTVLPGTMWREVEPELGNAKLAYTPAFIAMGTAIRDFTDPEFILLGGDPDGVTEEFYETILPYAKLIKMSVPNAELTKVAYNTWISSKLAFVNTLGQLCASLPGTDVDVVTDALGQAHRRLISTAYLKAGMGDGGGCHPRDNIALSWLAQKTETFDLFDAIMRQREEHTRWLADILVHLGDIYRLPIGVCGIAYKPDSHLTDGSAALLLAGIAGDMTFDSVEQFDPHVDHLPDHPTEAGVYLIGCNHSDYQTKRWPDGSVLIDPFGTIPEADNISLNRPGR